MEVDLERTGKTREVKWREEKWSEDKWSEEKRSEDKRREENWREEKRREERGEGVLRSLRETLRGDRGAIVDIDFMEKGQWIIEGEIYMRENNGNSGGREKWRHPDKEVDLEEKERW